MKPHDKVVLFGSYDGFGWSTLAENSVFVMLDNGDRVEVPEYLVKDASEFVEKDKMKLKDVIARIQKLDLGTQKVWLNEILNELGSDYGASKYKGGYEQGKRYLVKMNGVKDIMGFLNFGGITKLWFMGDEKNLYGCRTHHTRKELEDAGFGDVFNSPLFEVEEVEE